jgi:hypothetical protein
MHDIDPTQIRKSVSNISRLEESVGKAGEMS